MRRHCTWSLSAYTSRPAAPHGFNVSHPEEFNQALLSFLQS
ncbi:hypothetical protein SGUI_2046 [Serinicoccus hydrothermalis]|uniref:Uncharacterized protein n=1 Tax=Serinicoccus hydrothermalis TaxID=1758689 RepID=A0A1B1NDD2_9MICO|nr:hypothetical protein [Serinicoccus hydrothermalis]ANS79442.1 hypothetical protein SGUI_2046 [Serinicoccus hydrothermalis]